MCSGLLQVRKVREMKGGEETGKIPEFVKEILRFVHVNVNKNIAFSISGVKGYSVMFQT